MFFCRRSRQTESEFGSSSSESDVETYHSSDSGVVGLLPSHETHELAPDLHTRKQSMVFEGQQAVETRRFKDGAPMPQRLSSGDWVTAKYCGMRKQQVLDFYETCRDGKADWAEGTWSEEDNVEDFNRKFVKPFCKKYSTLIARMSVALIVNEEEPICPTMMISHAWAENASEFFEDVREHVEDDEIPWICLFSNYQGTQEDIAAQLGKDIRVAPFTEVLKSPTCKRMLIMPNEALRNSGGLYSRLWCVWEIYTAANLKLPIDISHRSSYKHVFGKTGSLDSLCDARCSSAEDTRMIKRAIEATPPKTLKGQMLWDQIVLLCGLYGLAFSLRWRDDSLGRTLGIYIGLGIGIIVGRACSGMEASLFSYGPVSHSYRQIGGVVNGVLHGFYRIRRLRQKDYFPLLASVCTAGLASWLGSAFFLQIGLQEEYTYAFSSVGAFNAFACCVTYMIAIKGSRQSATPKRIFLLLSSWIAGGLSLWLTWDWPCLSYLEGFVMGETIVFAVGLICLQPVPLHLKCAMLVSSGAFGLVGWAIDGLFTWLVCGPFGAMFAFSALLPEWNCCCQFLYAGFILGNLAIVMFLNVEFSSVHGACSTVPFLFGSG